MNAVKTFACGVCEKSFKQKYNMTVHTRIHTGEKPFECMICKKTFSQSSSFALHKRIHTGEKPYECNVCEKAFTSLSTLANHKKIHTGEKPFECDICKKAFTHSSTLTYHKRIHTGEKPFECDICKKAFKLRKTLADHKKKHTGEKPYNCDICQKSCSNSSNLSRHCNTAAHLKIKESNNTDFSSTDKNFVDCGVIIKLEYIKEEINEGESVDPLSIQGETLKGENENINTEVKEEVINDDFLCTQEIHDFEEGENNTVFDDIDIVQHKIEPDNF